MEGRAVQAPQVGGRAAGADETEAWAAFCDGNREAQRNPKLFERVIELLEIDEKVDQPELMRASEILGAEVTATNGPADHEAPTAEDSAEVAKDKISRMVSREKLRDIVANEKRPTVSKAAEKRLQQLGENDDNAGDGNQASGD